MVTNERSSNGNEWYKVMNMDQKLKTDKMGYQVNIFLISPRKHKLWVFIRSASFRALMSTHNVCFCGGIRRI